MSNITVKPTITPQQARELLWRQGDITYLLDRNQLELYNIYKTASKKTIVWNCCRGMGKSYLLVSIAIMECLKKSNTLVKYACPTQKMAREIVQPIFRDILENCPKDIKPEFIASEGAYRFSNGSYIQLSGLDGGKAENIRGGSARLAIVDEAAAVKASNAHGDLEYIVRSILLPAVTRNKKINGKVILASTPPENPNHKFVMFMGIARNQGTLSTKTAYDCPRYIGENSQILEDILENCGPEREKSLYFRREYLCHIIVDPARVVVGEFTDEIEKTTVREWQRPPFAHNYVAMDVGGKDFTAVLFAYYDFSNAKIVIVDEVVKSILLDKKFTTKQVAEAIKEKEAIHFTNQATGEFEKPFKRVSDNNLIFINDMYHLHQLLFEPTRKDDFDAALNNLKILIAAGRVIIHPRCQYLIRHLKEANWNNTKTSFNKSSDGGHFDCLAALIYLVRNVDMHLNPFPAGYGIPTGPNYFQRNKQVSSQYAWAIKQILNIKK